MIPKLRAILCQLTFLILMVVPVSTAMGEASKSARKTDPMLRQAEAAANRIVQRFHKTLEFNGIFADEFVSDPKLRDRGLSLNEEEKLKQFDLASRERLYVALMTWLHLWSEYMLIQSENEIPPEVKNLNPEPDFFKNATSEPPRTVQELNQDISDLEMVSALYRKQFSEGAFGNSVYLENIRKGREYAKANQHNVPRVEQGNAKFGIPENVAVYVVRPEAFDYYFVQEKGRLKLFYVEILPNFKLF